MVRVLSSSLQVSHNVSSDRDNRVGRAQSHSVCLDESMKVKSPLRHHQTKDIAISQPPIARATQVDLVFYSRPSKALSPLLPSSCSACQNSSHLVRPFHVASDPSATENSRESTGAAFEVSRHVLHPKSTPAFHTSRKGRLNLCLRSAAQHSQQPTLFDTSFRNPRRRHHHDDAAEQEAWDWDGLSSRLARPHVAVL